MTRAVRHSPMPQIGHHLSQWTPGLRSVELLTVLARNCSVVGAVRTTVTSGAQSLEDFLAIGAHGELVGIPTGHPHLAAEGDHGRAHHHGLGEFRLFDIVGKAIMVALLDTFVCAFVCAFVSERADARFSGHGDSVGRTRRSHGHRRSLGPTDGLRHVTGLPCPSGSPPEDEDVDQKPTPHTAADG